ncbi:MAG: replication restart helicase PriA [Bacteroidota bacterium]
MQYFVDVILPLPLKKSFTYQVSKSEFDLCQKGIRVAVPFGKSKVYTGIVYRLHHNPPLHYDTKFVEQLMDEKPLVTEQQFQLWEWISSYYMASLGDVMRAALPSALLIESETVIELNKSIEINQEDLTDNEYLIFEALQNQSLLKIQDVMKILNRKTVLPIINQLVDKNILIVNQEMYKKYQPKLTKYIRLNPAYESKENLPKILAELENAPKQKEAVLHFFSISARRKKPISAKDLSEDSGVSVTTIKALVKKEIFEEYQVKQDRINFSGEKTNLNIALSEHQQKALEEILAGFKQKDVAVLHGVTSSGKTEIYIKLIEKVIKNDQQVLFLLPEIALTTQLIKRLQAYFGEEVMVFHSKYSINERVETYQHILHQSKGKIVVGTRSSLFLPFTDLGLVIVDESHENSYKQYDPAPRYHARDAAIVLASIFKSKTLLGSATPSIESFQNIKKNKFAYIRLSKRFGNVLEPDIQLVDIKTKHKKKQMTGHFSDTLLKAISATLKEGKQVILFQNRRGFSPFLECKTCGHSPHCPNCDVSLTYHKYNNSLRCHMCSYSIAMQTKCLSCGSSEIDAKGFGTEQIESELQSLFEKTNIHRMDFDTTRGKYAYDKIIAAFENREIDILVGTQMLTKGLDFRNVDLVGVLNADSLLNFPDFRAFEKSFQLLVQVAGRAGRTDTRGKVLIQTFNPYHQILQQVTTNDFKGMYKDEIYQRKNFNYPPFYRLIKITLKSRDYNKLNEGADWLTKFLKQAFSKNVLGPEFPAIARIRNQYHKNILIKIPPQNSLEKTKQFIHKGIDSFNAVGAYRSIKINIDVDPN